MREHDESNRVSVIRTRARVLLVFVFYFFSLQIIDETFDYYSRVAASYVRRVG